jgi:prepilin signal peptidase PulO-like enzyme (type II secretory pathway)
MVDAIIAGAIFGFLYAIFKGQWLGAGDVKLIIFLALLFGLSMFFVILIIATIAALCDGIIRTIRKTKTPNKEIPFGAYLASASLLTLFLQPIAVFFFK